MIDEFKNTSLGPILPEKVTTSNEENKMDIEETMMNVGNIENNTDKDSLKK